MYGAASLLCRQNFPRNKFPTQSYTIVCNYQNNYTLALRNMKNITNFSLTLHPMKKIILSILLSVTLISAIHSIVGVTEYVIDNGLGTYSSIAKVDVIESLPMADCAISVTGLTVPPSAFTILRNITTAFILTFTSALLLLSFYGNIELKLLNCLRSVDNCHRLLPYHGFV